MPFSEGPVFPVGVDVVFFLEPRLHPRPLSLSLSLSLSFWFCLSLRCRHAIIPLSWPFPPQRGRSRRMIARGSSLLAPSHPLFVGERHSRKLDMFGETHVETPGCYGIARHDMNMPHMIFSSFSHLLNFVSCDILGVLIVFFCRTSAASNFF